MMSGHNLEYLQEKDGWEWESDPSLVTENADCREWKCEGRRRKKADGVGVRGAIVLLKFHDMLLSSFKSYFLHVSFISFHLPPHHQLLNLFPSPCFYRLLFSNLTVPHTSILSFILNQSPACSLFFYSFFLFFYSLLLSLHSLTSQLSSLSFRNSFLDQFFVFARHSIISKR